MADVSEEELEAIKANPFGAGLDAFHDLVKSKYLYPGLNHEDMKQVILSGCSDTREYHAHTFFILSNQIQGAQNLVLDLILALQSQQAARVLPSRNVNGPLSGDLASLYSRISSTKTGIKPTASLLELVVRHASDEKIWSAVFSLVAITRTTPPTAFEKAVFDTPLRSGAASQRGIEQTHNEVDQRIVEELTGRVHDNVGGFYERYFEEKNWSNNARDIYEESRA
jgi:hypothetical protein